MIRHLQYHLGDMYPSNIDDLRGISGNIYINECDGGNKYIRIKNTSMPDKYFNPIVEDDNGNIKFNTELLHSYPTFHKNLASIREETDIAIMKFIQSGGRIRDLLYRINTIEPIERENMNRGNKFVTYNDNFNNHTLNYLTSGMDDMVTAGLMCHELESILLYLLIGSSIKIDINYQVYIILNLIYKLTGIKEGIEAEDYKINPEFSFKYYFLKSLLIFDKNISFNSNIGKDFIRNKIAKCKSDMVYKKSGTLTITIDNKDSYKSSLALEILRLYINNEFYDNEIEHDMSRLSVCNPRAFLSDIKNFNITDLLRFSLTEGFRNIMHHSSIILYKLIVFNFMQYLLKKLNVDKITIRNPIDKALYSNREFQSYWIMFEEIYSSKELFKAFEEFVREEIILNDKH